MAQQSAAEKRAIKELIALHGKGARQDIARGVFFAHRVSPDSEDAFVTFCKDHYVPPGKQKEQLLKIVDHNIDALFGYFGMMRKRMRLGSDLNDRPMLPVDRLFGSFFAASHLSEDLYQGRISAFVQLNFGTDEVESPKSRVGWAMRRVSQFGRERVPAKLVNRQAVLGTAVDSFISDFNLPLDRIKFPDPSVSFPKQTFLKSHWGLRDYMTALRGTPNALAKQRAIRDLMRRVVDGEIPRQVLNDPSASWDIVAGTVEKKGKVEKARYTGALRWEKFKPLFDTQREIDPHTIYGNLIDRKFKLEREMDERRVVRMLHEAMSSPLAKDVAKYIGGVLGRPVEAHDIYFRDFAPVVSKRGRGKSATKLFPNAAALEKAIPSLLVSFGWSQERAAFIGSKIRVHNSRSAGHAISPCTKEDVQYLRVPAIPGRVSEESVETFMHELGHAVEQVITKYEMDYPCLAGVPNTAFTEAFAFTFQEKTPLVLGKSVERDTDVETLVRYWELFEIAGPSLVEIEFFHWLYKNKNASAEQMHRKIRSIADSVWKKYYARVLGADGCGLLAVYSHILWCSFYLADYFIGYVIAYQVRKHLRGKNLASEMERMCRVGSIYPNDWMRNAVRSDVSLEPLLVDLESALSRLSRTR